MAESLLSAGRVGALLRALISTALIVVFPLSPGFAEDVAPPPRVAVQAPSAAEMTEILRALSLVADYRRHQRDRERLEEVLSRYHGLPAGEDPFAFRSRRLRELLRVEEPEREALEDALEELSGAIDELRHYVEEE